MHKIAHTAAGGWFERACPRLRTDFLQCKAGSGEPGLNAVDVKNLESDVVRTAAIAGQRNQGSAGVGHRLVAQRVVQFFLGNKAPEAVGAKQQPVPCLEWNRQIRPFRRDLGSCSQSCGKDVTLGMGFGFLRADHTGSHQSPNIRMVGGQPVDAGTAH